MTLDQAETVPYEWLKSVDPSIAGLDTVPLLGFPPSFPYASFSSHFSQTFAIDDFTIKPGRLQWREPDQLTGDLGDQVYLQKVTLSSFEGDLHIALDREDLRFLTYTMLNKSRPSDIQVYDEDIEKGLRQFIALEAVRAFSECGFDQTLNPHLHEAPTLPDSPALTLDIAVSLMEKAITIRLVISQAFQKAWKEHYANRSMGAPVSKELLKTLEAAFQIEIGKAALSRDEYQSLKEGDLLILDQSLYDPDSQSGQAVLTLNGSPKLRGKLEKNRLHIQDAPLFYEEVADMIKEKGDESHG